MATSQRPSTAPPRDSEIARLFGRACCRLPKACSFLPGKAVLCILEFIAPAFSIAGCPPATSSWESACRGGCAAEG